MATLQCKKVYHNPKVDKKGKQYDLINILADNKRYTMFDYSGDNNGLQDGDTLDISGYEQQPNEYNGKTSIVLSKPKKQNPGTAAIEERVKALEDRFAKMVEWGQKVTSKLNL